MSRAHILFLLAALILGPVLVYGQDDVSPSLGDVARQARIAKQQKDAQAGAAPIQDSSGAATTGSKDFPSQRAAGTAQSKAQVSAATPMPPAKSPQSSKPAKRVITNEDMGATHTVTGSTEASETSSAQPETFEKVNAKNPPEYWTNQIAAQKSSIASLQSNIDQLSASIQYAPGNCVEGCAEWNQRQQEKQQQVDNMKAQLEQLQKQLEETQESARKQGYGSSVYDP